ncbi:methyl-accepting chemotaxis protein [Planosporangium thailandense]|uniref:Methyl-accepting chemotaxis protein n=1 Tax=Planosporangium thailandense TaxID=765197 RepID=A0ABX0Y653_9ACTN|nr:methyl-accepting chemotaxis protein [Planosporangium thailandense]NJC73518.1 methyl-accepting chemotaxis protein [Planosporangium thailandense]
MYKVLNRIPAKARNVGVLLCYLAAILTLSIVGHSAATRALAALPAGSSARGGLHTLATLSVWIPVLLPVAVVVQLSVQLTVVRGLRHAAQVAMAAAEGDMTMRMEVLGKDELTLLANSFNTMAAQVGDTIRRMRETADRLAAAATGLESASTSMDGAVHQTSDQLENAHNAAERSSHDIAGIAISTDEMQRAIGEISVNTTAVSTAAAGAIETAKQAAVNVEELRDSSHRIGEVVRTITAIAAQTNLLALNATIEAARAGEAGRGFAIVAGEVKELANATAAATEEITQKIHDIQVETERAVEAVASVASEIESIASYQHTIASAVEEQTAATHAMASGTGNASQNSAAATAAITGVRDAAAQASEATAHTRDAATEIAAMSTELTTLAAAFRC